MTLGEGVGTPMDELFSMAWATLHYFYLYIGNIKAFIRCFYSKCIAMNTIITRKNNRGN